MNNDLAALNNALFEQIERLQDDELTVDEMQKEINRSKAITDVSKTIIENAKLALDFQKHLDEYGIDKKVNIPLIG